MPRMPPFGGATNPAPAVSRSEPLTLDRLFTEAYGVLLDYTSVDPGHVLVKMMAYGKVKVALLIPFQQQIDLSWDGVNNMATLTVANGEETLQRINAGFGFRDLLNEVISQVKPQDPRVPKSPTSDIRLLTLWRDNFTRNFSLDQLKDLCVDLGLDFESVSGEGKSGKAREMALYLARRSEWRRATAYLEANYPQMSWR